MYRILFHRNANKKIRKILRGDRTYAEKIAEEIKGLRRDPHPANSTSLAYNLNKLRIGDYRVIYSIVDADNVIVIGKISRRSESTYKDLESIARRTISVLKKKGKDE